MERKHKAGLRLKIAQTLVNQTQELLNSLVEGNSNNQKLKFEIDVSAIHGATTTSPIHSLLRLIVAGAVKTPQLNIRGDSDADYEYESSGSRSSTTTGFSSGGAGTGNDSDDDPEDRPDALGSPSAARSGAGHAAAGVERASTRKKRKRNQRQCQSSRNVNKKYAILLRTHCFTHASVSGSCRNAG